MHRSPLDRCRTEAITRSPPTQAPPWVWPSNGAASRPEVLVVARSGIRRALLQDPIDRLGHDVVDVRHGARVLRLTRPRISGQADPDRQVVPRTRVQETERHHDRDPNERREREHQRRGLLRGNRKTNRRIFGKTSRLHVVSSLYRHVRPAPSSGSMSSPPSGKSRQLGILVCERDGAPTLFGGEATSSSAIAMASSIVVQTYARDSSALSKTSRGSGSGPARMTLRLEA